ncbi:MAG: D-glycerate dehydrogenase [Candidatus Taylorbacteria bacterium]
MKKVFITRKIPDIGISMLKNRGYEVDVSPYDRPLSKNELIDFLHKKPYDAVLTLLTDMVDAEVYDAAPTVKIFANYAIGFNNFNVEEGKKRGIALTNTPGGGADRVAEHAWGLILALSCRIVEGDEFVRAGKYNGWDPMIFHGIKVAGKTLGLIGAGRIGSEVARIASKGFGMRIAYHDIARNQKIESLHGASFWPTIEDVLKQADIISIHVPLNESTHHLIDASHFKLMKPTAFVINTSRGPVVDEQALFTALQNKVIAGAGLDVLEFEPRPVKGLAELPNVIITPHIASATEEARQDMAILSTQNIINILEGGVPANMVY